MDNLEAKLHDAGMKHSVIAVTIGVMRGFLRDGVDWETVSGQNIVERCAGHPARLHRVRRGLIHAFTDAEARRRWPEVFRRTNARGSNEDPKKPTIENILPVELLRRTPEDTVRSLFYLLFRKLCRRGGMTLASSFRVNLSFLYGFLCATSASLWPDAHIVTEDVIKARLRALTHEELVRADGRDRQESSRGDRSLSLQALCTQLNFLTVVFRDVLGAVKRPLLCSDFGIVDVKRGHQRGRKRAADTASTASVGASTVTSALSAFNEDPPIVDRSGGAGWVREALKSTVHCFNAAEVRALYLHCQTDLERLLVAALFTTGMRIGGFCLAKRDGVVVGRPPSVTGEEITTNEKYNRIRRYPVARSLAVLLPGWVAAGQCGDVYLFPGTPGGDRPMDTRRARTIFMGVAARAGLQGSHVKPHTTRHTVCWTLSALGNKLEEISDFAGHRSTSVTNDVYIAMDEAQKRSRMDIPWLETDGRSGAERLQDTALELAAAIAGPFASEDGRTFPDYRRAGHHQPIRRVTVVEPPVTVDEEQHHRVAAASLSRAEKKAARKAQQILLKAQLRNQMVENGALLKQLLNSSH